MVPCILNDEDFTSIKVCQDSGFRLHHRQRKAETMKSPFGIRHSQIIQRNDPSPWQWKVESSANLNLGRNCFQFHIELSMWC